MQLDLATFVAVIAGGHGGGGSHGEGNAPWWIVFPIVGGTLLLLMVLSVVLGIFRKRYVQRRAAHMAAHGRDAVAIVREVRQIGTQVAKFRKLVVTLELEAAGFDPWIIDQRVRVPRETDIANAVGTRLPARFDPRDQRHVVVSWGQRA